MPALRDSIMQNLYGQDIWADFKPATTATLQGWNGDHPSLAQLSSLSDHPLVIDVGVWKGMSTINMALAMKKAGLDGCIIGVDTFLGSPEHWDARLFSRRHGLPDLYMIFMSNVWTAGVSDYIVPLAQTSVTAAHILRSRGLAPSLVHIDAAHEYAEVIRDAEEYYGLLAPGGFLIGDDYDISWPGVVKAAGEFSSRNGVPLMVQPPKWIMKKPLA